MGLRETRRSRDFPLWPAPALPDGMITMMTLGERDLLYSLARFDLRGEGCVVDAGIFMGASTACFAEGLAQNETVAASGRTVEIHSYELAVTTPAMKAHAEQAGGAPAGRLGAVGESYAPLLRETLSPWPNVRLHVGDVLEARFEPQPIELLFLDILKSPRIQNHCVAQFMPHLIPGRSVIVQQDYFWHFGWFINAYMERFRDCFEPVDGADTSMAFRLVKPLPREAFAPQAFLNVRRRDTLDLLEGARHTGRTLAQHLTYRLCVISFVLYEMGPTLAEMKLREFESRFGDILVAEHHRPEILRVAQAYGEIRNRIRAAFDKPGLAKVYVKEPVSAAAE